MNRRALLKRAGALALLPLLPTATRAAAKPPFRRVRPSDPDWPSVAEWQELSQRVEGRLLKVESPFTACAGTPVGPACDELFRAWKNPYATGDQPALTQTSGWADAWVSEPSAYAVVHPPFCWLQFYLRGCSLAEINAFTKDWRRSAAAVGLGFGTEATMGSERFFEAGEVAKAV